MGVTVASGRWMRRDGRCRICAAFAVAWVLAFVGMAVWVWVPDSESVLSAGESAGFSLFMIAMASPGVVIAVRCLRAGLWLSSSAAVVRCVLRTHTIPLDQIERFTPEVTTGPGNGMPCVALELRDGRLVGVFALGREGWVWRFDRLLQELQPLCESLNGLLATLRDPPTVYGLSATS